jgi:hypothetical protein
MSNDLEREVQWQCLTAFDNLVPKTTNIMLNLKKGRVRNLMISLFLAQSQ